MSDALSLIGGDVLSPDGTFMRGDLHIAGGVVVADGAAAAERLDCRGLLVLPGLVDAHGDAFEPALFPRPGVEIPFEIAMTAVDRQLIAAGITTAFHGLTLSWEPGARSLEAGRRFMDALPARRARMAADHHVQLRWETFAHDAIDDIGRWLSASPRPALAFNDHTTSTLKTIERGDASTLERWARRAGVSFEAYVAEAEKAADRADAVAARIAEVAALCRRCGAVALSHDERTVAERRANRALGLRVCEFPLARDVAADATAHAEAVVMGGPNVLRGVSHKGALSAEDAIRDGVCTVLASDYYYPSMLHAVERLARRGVAPLADAWALISANPASALGLDDRGALAPGMRGDVVVVDASAAPWRVVRTIAGGSPTRFAS